MARNQTLCVSHDTINIYLGKGKIKHENPDIIWKTISIL